MNEWQIQLEEDLNLDPPKRTYEMTRLRWSEALSRPWALHSLGEAPSRLRWPADLRRSHRVPDASVDPGLDLLAGASK